MLAFYLFQEVSHSQLSLRELESRPWKCLKEMESLQLRAKQKEQATAAGKEKARCTAKLKDNPPQKVRLKARPQR